MTELEARTLCVDLDFTLCTHTGDYAAAVPIPGAREALEKLRADGWIIVIQTARHFNQWRTSADWLADHGFTYDQLVFGKPPARFYIDDRAIAFDGDWQLVRERLPVLPDRGSVTAAADSGHLTRAADSDRLAR